jgi:uncharacterized protein YbjT (DUF2867 family)
MNNETVLVTAGNGNQARAVIPRLLKAGFRVRAMRCVDRSGPGPGDLGAQEVIIGDAGDPDDAFGAMEGAHAVYHVGPSFHPQEREMGFNMIRQAKRAGIEHFIFSSVLHPLLTGLPQHAIKRDIEEHLVESGLNFTILQPADYMQMVSLGVLPDNSLFLLGWDLDKRQALVDLDDVAEALVRIITGGESHYGATYELSNGENLSGHGIAESLSRAFGRPFTASKFQHNYERPIPDILGHYDEEHMRHQMSVFKIVNEWYDRYDFIGNSNVLRMLLGRNPTSFADFARKRFNI